MRSRNNFPKAPPAPPKTHQSQHLVLGEVWWGRHFRLPERARPLKTELQRELNHAARLAGIHDRLRAGRSDRRAAGLSENRRAIAGADARCAVEIVKVRVIQRIE